MAKKGKKKAAKEKIGVAERKRAEELIAKPIEKQKREFEKLKLGDHLCSIYKNKKEQLSVIIPFIFAGLKNNEKCVYIVEESTKKEIAQAFKKLNADIEGYINSKQFEFLTKEDTYLKDGYFDPDRMIELLKQSEDIAIKDGYKGLRVTGEMTWVFTKLRGVEKLIEYEAKLNYFFPQSRSTAICQYNESKFTPKILLDVIRTHPKIILYGSICGNPYYIPPDEFFARMKGEIPREIYERVRDDVIDRTKRERVLKRAEEALHKAHDELGARVAERTEELSQANIRLKELDKLKSMFMSSMSHELRTPLNSIIGFTGVMLQGIAGELTEEQRKQLTMVKNSSDHLLSMVTDIIDLNKIEAGKIGVLIKETDIAKTIDEVLATFADKIREKGLALKKNIPEKLIISTDEKRFKQILINLLDNAVKFTVEGSIEVDCKVKGEEIEISVKDTGPGIREEGIEELFRPFAQVDYEFKVKYGGPGIGLYLSKRIVELLGGKIWAESEFGKGSIFTFVLPIKGAKA